MRYVRRTKPNAGQKHHSHKTDKDLHDVHVSPSNAKKKPQAHEQAHDPFTNSSRNNSDLLTPSFQCFINQKQIGQQGAQMNRCIQIVDQL